MHPETVTAVDRAVHGGSDDPSLLDFSANVNPRQPAGAAAVYGEAFEACGRYAPEPPERYRNRAAEYVGCSPDGVVPTPGGLAAIRLAIEVSVGVGDTVIVPRPSFGEFAREVELQGATPRFVPADEVPDADPEGDALAILCHPNNPTGLAYDRADIEAFVERCREAATPVLIDEAFLGFTDRPSLAGTAGAIVARSLTKLFGLPGLRMGFAVARNGLADRLLAARPPWNVGTPALRVGAWCMDQDAFVAETRRQVATERDRMRRALSDRFDVPESNAPFLLLGLRDRSVDTVIDRLSASGIAVRDARSFRGLDNHIRVAVRRPEENDRLLEALDDV